MKSKSLKEKLRSRERVFGTWTSLAHPSITEIFSNTGCDFVGIDIEHSTYSLEQCQRTIAAAQAAGSFCLPRVGSHNFEWTKRLLDSGADGLIYPMVNTAQEVKNVISWMKYPPMGVRSYGVNRAQNYGFNFEMYSHLWNDSSTLIVQIESIEGVNNLDNILCYDEVDGVMIGPYDLSGTMGIPGELDHPKVLEACDKVIAACAKHKKACGTQVVDPNPESVHLKFKQGYTFTVLSSDIFLMWKWAERMQGLIKEVQGS